MSKAKQILFFPSARFKQKEAHDHLGYIVYLMNTYGTVDRELDVTLEEYERWRALLATVEENNIWVWTEKGKAKNLGSAKEVSIFDIKDDTRLYGALPTTAFILIGEHLDLDQRVNVNQNLTWNKLGERVLGRKLRLCGYETIEETLDAFWAEGETVLAVKPRIPKRFEIRKVELTADDKTQKWRKAIYENEDAFGITLIDYVSGISADDEQAAAIAPWIPMSHEVRFFVAGEKLATYSGNHECDEKCYPIDCQNLVIDENNNKVELPHLILVEMAELAGAKLKEVVSNYGVQDFVIDIALDNSMTPVVVELNEFNNAGIYASRQENVVEQLLGMNDGVVTKVPLYLRKHDYSDSKHRLYKFCYLCGA